MALAEIGDKTQLLAFLLAAKFQHRCRSWLKHPGGDAGQPCAGRRRGRVDQQCDGARSDALDPRRLLHRHGRVDAGARQDRRRRSQSRSLRRFPGHAGRVLPRRDGRQDPGRDGGAGRAF
ncbi:TMEM165/GDT1 family protein [Massilia sp. B-10]|nr:TMEM165/GDT1 family protein [Massilia sp. B-10]